MIYALSTVWQTKLEIGASKREKLNLNARLYDGDLTNQVIENCTKQLNKLVLDGEPKAPFQFTLPVMAAMYLDFCGKSDACTKLIMTKNGENFCDTVAQKLYCDPPWGGLDPFHNTNHQGPLKTPIRAIAYFSWEESSRIFLVRRVYPSFFNFLSYSHCPERWGALGIALVELHTKNNEEYFGLDHLGITEVPKFSQAALPFLSEVHRLKYTAIFVIPVVKEWGKFSSTSELLGAFVIFVDDKKNLPLQIIAEHDKPKFMTWVKSFVSLFNIAIKEQEKLFLKSDAESQLAVIWRNVIQKTKRRPHNNHTKSNERPRVYELVIKPAFNVATLNLENVVSGIIARLGDADYYAIVDKAKTDLLNKKKAVLLVAPANEVNSRREDIRGTLLRAIGAAYHEPDQIKLNVTIRTL